MRKIAMTLGLACGFLLLLMLALQTRAAPAMPAGRHCGDGLPLPLDDPKFCGCTWGEVLFHGRPVLGAVVTITYGGGAEIDVTHRTKEEPEPYFDLTAHFLGARRGDVVTLSARFAGQTVERAIRAWPEAEGEQRVVLAFLERGVWSPWVTGGYTRALALAGDTVWAGGPAGVISVSLSTSVSVAHTLPWADPFVRALAVGTDGHVWAAGAGGVAEFDGSSWHAHAVPPIGTPRALAVDPDSGAIWLGGGDGTEGKVAVYTGTWQITGTFGAPVTALAVDGDRRVWAGTWEDGAHRQNGNGGWTPYRAVDGLASDQVLATVADAGAIWFGTHPYLSGQGPRGGIARYDLATEAWRVYTTAHGLPAYTLLPEAPAPVYALAMGEDGIPWAGTAEGVWFLASEGWWAGYTTTHGLRPGAVMALVVGGGTAVAATPAGLDRLDPAATSGAPPVAQITDVSPLTLTAGAMLTLNGGGWDSDEGGSRVVAWDWSSSLDGPVCTSNTCTLPHSLFTPGAHTIALKVQDDEGMWSEPVLETVVVEPHRVFLPLVVNQSQGP
jgi:hypothetical protein